MAEPVMEMLPSIAYCVWPWTDQAIVRASFAELVESVLGASDMSDEPVP